jgi:hypothetical protein
MSGSILNKAMTKKDKETSVTITVSRKQMKKEKSF